MRSWSFTFEREDECDYAFKQAFEMFKGTEDFRKKKVIICKGNENDGVYKLFMSIEDRVPGSFIISTSNAFGKPMKNVFTSVKADCKDINIELPDDCKIMSWYEADPAEHDEPEKK